MKQVKETLIVIFAALMAGIIIVLIINSTTSLETEDGMGSVVCGEGFFYDTSKGKPRWDTLHELEALAKLACDNEGRDEINYRHKDGPFEGELKHAVLIPRANLCVINWELTPVTNKVAFIEVCRGGWK